MEACVRKTEDKRKPKQEGVSDGSELWASTDNNKDPVSLNGEVPSSDDDQEHDVNSENLLAWSWENLTDTVGKVKKRAGLLKRSASTDNLFDKESNTDEDESISVNWENLLEAATLKEKTERLTGIFRRFPQPAPRLVATEDPLSSTNDLSSSWDSLADAAQSRHNNPSDATVITKGNKEVFAGMIRRTANTEEQQEGEDMEAPERGEPRRSRTIKKKRQVVSFRVKKILPKIPEVTLSSQTSDTVPFIQDDVELCELNPAQQGRVALQPMEMAAYPAENDPLGSDPKFERESDELMEWWNTVKGWTEWKKTSAFMEEDEEMIVEQAADRVYLAARLFVHLFNQRGASLQQRILELLCLADAADQFHKKTVRAAVGGGVASVVGSLATITGLILAPFTFGASVIVTAVGISVATAGSITSATANITDTVHSSMDRKKVEKMIQGYQEEIGDIRECLEFVQEGMDALQEWNFEQYSQSAAKKALNHSVKTVVREGGSAGRALLINTEKLISTVQILGAAGGAVKAAQVISVTTGVMSALFLALDVFFLAKDSHELRKGAKTQFAATIREVCRDLQHGLLELNKVKTQLQKTMDGIEVEEYEEIEEVEVEIEDDLEKLAELEQELDLLEEKLDKGGEEEQKKSKGTEKQNLKSTKENGEPEMEAPVREKYVRNEGKKGSEKEKDVVEDKLETKTEKIDDAAEAKRKSSTEASHSQHSRDVALHDDSSERGDENGGNRAEGARRQLDGEEEEEGKNQRREKECKHCLTGYRPRSNALLGGRLSLE